MAEDIKTAMIVNAARVKETAVRGLTKSRSSGNIRKAMNTVSNKRGSYGGQGAAQLGSGGAFISRVIPRVISRV